MLQSYGKKLRRKYIKSYRPIAILSCPAKIFESMIHKQIYNYVRNKISHRQYGFLKNKSTVTNVCNITQYIAEKLDKKCQVDVVYTDFTKAFKCIPHNIFLKKLENEKLDSGVSQGFNFGTLMFTTS